MLNVALVARSGRGAPPSAWPTTPCCCSRRGRSPGTGGNAGLWAVAIRTPAATWLRRYVSCALTSHAHHAPRGPSVWRVDAVRHACLAARCYCVWLAQHSAKAALIPCPTARSQESVTTLMRRATLSGCSHPVRSQQSPSPLSSPGAWSRSAHAACAGAKRPQSGACLLYTSPSPRDS